MKDEVIHELNRPLDARHVKSRSQSGRSLSYVEGWWVIAEANRIFGFDGWQRETIEMREVRPPELVKSSNGKETWRVGFIAKVRVTVGCVIREGTGFGAGALPDLGEAYESAIKEAETDAMKRAFMTFGNPFGLALYDKAQENVDKSGGAEQRPKPEAKKRADAPRLTDPADIAAVFDALTRNMKMHPTKPKALEWAEKQAPQIEGLPDAEYQKFREAFAAHLKTLPLSTLEAA